MKWWEIEWEATATVVGVSRVEADTEEEAMELFKLSKSALFYDDKEDIYFDGMTWTEIKEE